MSRDDAVRTRQAKVLLAVRQRIERGEALLPTDVFIQVEQDLELRIDEAAIAEAWAMEPEPPPSSRSAVPPQSSIIKKGPIAVRMFKHAEHELHAMAEAPRTVVAKMIEGLAYD